MSLVMHGVGVRRGRRDVLRDVSLTARPGRMLAVLGASGSGKTTVLALLGGLVAPTSGEVRLDGARVVVDDATRLARTGIVLQANGLVPVLTVRENVEVALQVRGVPRHDVGPRALAALQRVGLDDLGGRLVDQLSGGQQQRAGVARALVVVPDVLLADEPTSELDAGTRDLVVAQLRAEADRGAVVVVATHDPDVASVCDDALELVDGRPVR